MHNTNDQQSLRIVPSPSAPSSHSHLGLSAPSAPGVFDTLRASHAPSDPSALRSSHPLESRLALWTHTQTSLRATLLRRTYGVAAPVLRAMELRDVARCEAIRPAGLYDGFAGGSVHGDILAGTDCEVGGWEGIYGGEMAGADWHGEMERGLGMW